MRVYTLLWVCFVAVVLSTPAQAREQLRIVGSSTVFPYTTIAAEQFGMSGEFRTPIVESTGTGGGFKLFCEGVGEDYPDINDASRPILPSEVKKCAEHGISEPLELQIGFDGIVIVNSKQAPQFHLNKKQMFLALVREIPDASGKLKPNPYKRWRDVDPSLPNLPIILYGPPPTSGTRDAFVELVMEEGCHETPAFAAAFSDKSELKKHCTVLREDGGFIEAGEDDNLIIQKLETNHDALGILGFAFYEENKSKIQASIIERKAPTTEDIADGTYPVARSLFIYIKKEHIGLVPGLKEFATEMVSDGASGAEGYLSFNGLIPLPKNLHDAFIAKVNNLSANP